MGGGGGGRDWPRARRLSAGASNSRSAEPDVPAIDNPSHCSQQLRNASGFFARRLFRCPRPCSRAVLPYVHWSITIPVTLVSARGGGGGCRFGTKNLCTKNGLTRFSRLQISFFLRRWSRGPVGGGGGGDALDWPLHEPRTQRLHSLADGNGADKQAVHIQFCRRLAFQWCGRRLGSQAKPADAAVYDKRRGVRTKDTEERTPSALANAGRASRCAGPFGWATNLGYCPEDRTVKPPSHDVDRHIVGALWGSSGLLLKGWGLCSLEAPEKTFGLHKSAPKAPDKTWPNVFRGGWCGCRAPPPPPPQPQWCRVAFQKAYKGAAGGGGVACGQYWVIRCKVPRDRPLT